jgi:hypothetical protein
MNTIKQLSKKYNLEITNGYIKVLKRLVDVNDLNNYDVWEILDDRKGKFIFISELSTTVFRRKSHEWFKRKM